MRFGDLLQDRDLTMEAQILNTLPLEQRELIRPQLRRAILKAAELWASKYLPIYLHGEKAAERTLQAQVPRE